MISGQRTYRLVRGMDDGDREWNSREKAQKAQKSRVFASLVHFRGYLDCVLSC